MRILFLGYWGLHDGLTVSTIFPHLRILQERPDVTAVRLVTIERGAEAQAKLTFAPGFEAGKISFEPLRSRPGRNVILNKIEDFTRFPNELVKQVAEFRPDFILARGTPAGSLAYLVWQKTKLPFYVESYEPHADYMLDSGVWGRYDPRYLFQRHWETKQKELALGLMPVAENYRQQLIREGVPAGRIVTMPCSVNTDAFAFNAGARARVRQRLGWPAEESFAKRAGVDVVTTLAGRGFTLGYGWLTAGSVGGLVLGEAFNRLTATISLLAGGIGQQLGELRRSFDWARIRAVAREYREFPLYFLPAGYVQTLSTQLPIFALSSGFGTTVVGLYSFSVSLLELPINLIGNAIAPVFLQKATETHAHEPERLPLITQELYYKMLYLGLLPFGVVTVFGDVLFRVAFGARWESAGLFTAFLGYYYVFRLTSQATGGIYTVFGKQRYLLLSNICLLLVRAAGLGLGLLRHDLNLGLLLFGIGSLTTTFLTDMHILSLLRLPVGRIAARSLLLLATTLILLAASRWGLEQVFPALAGHGILHFLRF